MNWLARSVNDKTDVLQHQNWKPQTFQTQAERNTHKLRPSVICYSEIHINCFGSNLENEIKDICTGQEPLSRIVLQVYHFQGKYCALDNAMLWKLQLAEKFQICSYVKVQVVARPYRKFIYNACDILILIEIGHVFFYLREIIKGLKTIETVRVAASEILYSSATIPEIYCGKSLVMALVIFRKNSKDLFVVRHEGKFYAIDNRKLWMHQQLSRIDRQKKNILVQVKLEMDSNMLKAFTCFAKSFKIERSRSYSHSEIEELFFDFLQEEKEEEDDDDDDDDEAEILETSISFTPPL